MTALPVRTPVSMTSGLSALNASVTSRWARSWNDRPNPPSRSSRFRQRISSNEMTPRSRSTVHRSYRTVVGSEKVAVVSVVRCIDMLLSAACGLIIALQRHVREVVRETRPLSIASDGVKSPRTELHDWRRHARPRHRTQAVQSSPANGSHSPDMIQRDRLECISMSELKKGLRRSESKRCTCAPGGPGIGRHLVRDPWGRHRAVSGREPTSHGDPAVRMGTRRRDVPARGSSRAGVPQSNRRRLPGDGCDMDLRRLWRGGGGTILSLLDLWEGTRLQTVGNVAPRPSPRGDMPAGWLRSFHEVLERHGLARDDQHVEFDRKIIGMPDLDAIRTLLETQPLRESVEMVDKPDVVAIDKHLRVARFHLETDSPRVWICGPRPVAVVHIPVGVVRVA